MEDKDELIRELKLQNNMLQRKNNRLQAECDILKEQNEKVSRTQLFFHRDNQRQLCYNSQLLKTTPYILVMVNEKLETVMASDVFFQKSEVSRDAVKEGISLAEAFSGILRENELQSFISRCESVLESQGTESYLLTTLSGEKECIYQVDICYYLAQNEDAKGLSIILSDMTEIVEAKKRAENADRAKSSFLASMSHEIRTPINAVLGMNEMILREARDRSIIEYSTNIRTAGRTLLYLINSILDFSKIEEGKMEIIPVEYDTAELLNSLVISVRERAGKKNLELQVDFDPLLPACMTGDDVRISQICMNLLTNAVKYTEKGTVSFCVRGGERKDGNIVLQVSVRDTGIGIRQEDIPKLFEIFERLDEVRNRNIEGNGLGISIVTRLLEMMGSQLKVESVYGQGSVFSFEITQKIVDESPIGDYELRMDTGKSSAVSETLSAGKSRILVVDDNEMNLKVAKNLFRLFDITPELVDSGFEALNRLRTQKPYHIIFLDHMMPHMDGIETLNHMKEEKLLPEGTSVIALTANAVNGAKERYLSAGFNGYLSKPIEVSDLEHLLLLFLPKELYSLRKTQEAGSMDSDIISELSAAGFDTESGLRYAGGDPDFYTELVSGFAEKCDRNTAALRSALEKREWTDYQIRVHAMKSTARQIGANELSDLALTQEMAAKERDEEAIKDGFAKLLGQYEYACGLIRGIFDRWQPDMSGKATDGTSASPDRAEKESRSDGAQSLTSEALRSAFVDAIERIDNFEAESAHEILRPFTALPADRLAEMLGSGVLCPDPAGALKRVVDALADFDIVSAKEQLVILSRLREQ